MKRYIPLLPRRAFLLGVVMVNIIQRVRKMQVLAQALITIFFPVSNSCQIKLLINNDDLMLPNFRI